MGPFDRVISSTLVRAAETAVAMGFAVNVEEELISTYGDEVQKEAPWPQTFAAYAKAISQGGATKKYAGMLFDFYAQFAGALHDGGSALVISHGGVVEIGAVACFPDVKHGAWGTHLGLCEGVRLLWNDGKFQSAEILRLEK